MKQQGILSEGLSPPKGKSNAMTLLGMFDKLSFTSSKVTFTAFEETEQSGFPPDLLHLTFVRNCDRVADCAAKKLLCCE